MNSDWANWNLVCTCPKSRTCLNLAMASADNPKPLLFSPGLPIPLSGRPIFLNLILTVHTIITCILNLSLLLSCKSPGSPQFSPQYFWLLPNSFFSHHFLIASILDQLLNHRSIPKISPLSSFTEVALISFHHQSPSMSSLVLQPLKNACIKWNARKHVKWKILTENKGAIALRAGGWWAVSFSGELRGFPRH